MPAIFGPARPTWVLRLALGVTALKVAALVALTAIVGMRVIPWLLDRVARTRSRELFTLAVLVIALGIAVGSAVVFGVSMALGAFLAGLVVGRSEFSLRAASDALPMRDAFAVLFFVSVGMLFEPASLLRSPGTVIWRHWRSCMIGKPLAAFLVMAVLRVPRTVALPVGVALSQVGEFSFILAALGRDLGVLTPDAMNLIVAVAIVSIVLNPILYKGIRPFEAWRTGAPSRKAPRPRQLQMRRLPPRRRRGPIPSRGHRRLRTQRTHRHAPAARKRRRTIGHRAERRDGPRAQERWDSRSLWRRFAPRNAGGRRARARGHDRPERRWPGAGSGNHPAGTRHQSWSRGSCASCLPAG